MSTTENVSTQERLAAAINSGDLEALHTIFADDVLDHDPAPEQGSGPGGFITFFAGLREAFPDLAVEPDALVSDDDYVCTAYRLSGTHSGTFLGVEPTGRRMEVRGVQIARFEEGKIVERWGSTDELGILTTLRAGSTREVEHEGPA